MDASGLLALLGGVSSLAFTYFPGLSAWYDDLVGDKKRAVMASFLLILTVMVFAASCAGIGIDPFRSPLPYPYPAPATEGPTADGPTAGGQIVYEDPGAVGQCSRAGALDLLGQFLIALMIAGASNQITFMLTPNGKKK